jgi:hypothetical protein
MSIMIHGSPGPGGRPAGKPVSGRMQPTDEQVGRQVRRDVQQLAGQTRLTGDALDKQALALVKTQHRGAVDLLGEEAIMALTRKLGPRACNWCSLRLLCAANGKQLPAATSALHAALGHRCGNCQGVYAALEAAAYEAPLVSSLTAAGIRPELAGVLRSAEEIARYKRGTAATAATGEVPVREAIRLARQRQQQREATYAAAGEPLGPWYGSRRVERPRRPW